jgi:hypothetical protein
MKQKYITEKLYLHQLSFEHLTQSKYSKECYPLIVHMLLNQHPIHQQVTNKNDLAQLMEKGIKEFHIYLCVDYR